MRQPLDPLPVREGVVAGDDGHEELVGCVLGNGGRHHGAGQATRGGLVTRDLDPGEEGQGQCCGQVGLDAVGRQQPVQGRGRHGVELGHGWGLGGLQRDAQRLARATEPHVEEVVFHSAARRWRLAASRTVSRTSAR